MYQYRINIFENEFLLDGNFFYSLVFDAAPRNYALRRRMIASITVNSPA
jgi:hypothetical protein